MNEPAAADEPVVETEPGEKPDAILNPHLGHQDPDQQKPDGAADEAEAAEGGDTPSPVEDSDDKDAPDDPKAEDDDVLRKKVGELAFENRQLKRQLEGRQQEAAEDAGEPEPEPLKTLKDFEYDEQAFNRYLIGVAKDEAKREALAESKKTGAESEAKRRQDEFEARTDAFEAENPGFKERLHAKDLHITPEMGAFISDPASEIGLHVGDYLSQNKAEAAKIAGLPATEQFREMVRLEDRIGKELAKAKAEKSKASKAPKPPVNPVDGTDPGGSSDPTNPADADKMSDEEWLAARNKQLAKR